MTAFTALGIDIGGTKTAIGVVGFPAGRVLVEKTIPTQARRASHLILENVANTANEVVARAGQAGEYVSGVGVGLCELVDLRGKILSHNCLSWTDAQVRSSLTHLGRVTLDADVRAAARAEALFGAGRSFRTFLFITVGTGIASCLVNGGVPYVGARGATGTMASSPLSWACDKCGHVKHLTLEEIASGPALVRRMNEARPGSATQAEDVFAAAANGEREALHIIRSAGEALGSTAALLVNVIDPEAVILGGGVGVSEGPFWPSFVDSTRRHIWFEGHRHLPILQAGLGVRAGMIGAAIAAWHSRH